jgi:hypothetical protein
LQQQVYEIGGKSIKTLIELMTLINPVLSKCFTDFEIGSVFDSKKIKIQKML